MYAVARLTWKHYLRHLTSFTRFSRGYTATRAAEALQLVKAAEALPNVARRRAVPKELRIQLKKQFKECIRLWRYLATYIESSFPVPLVKLKKVMAGSHTYNKASGKEWTAVITLMTDGNQFIKKHFSDLKRATDGMPDSFPTEFNTAMDAFCKLHNSLMSAKIGVNRGTGNKADANNAVFKELRKL